MSDLTFNQQKLEESVGSLNNQLNKMISLRDQIKSTDEKMCANWQGTNATLVHEQYVKMLGAANEALEELNTQLKYYNGKLEHFSEIRSQF